MTNVNITNTTNIVEVTTGNETVVVTAITPGPQGPGVSALADLQDVDVTGKENQGLLYYSTATAKFTVDGTNTVLSLTDGGNF